MSAPTSRTGLRPSRDKRVVVIVLVLVAVVLAKAFAWWSNPTVFGPPGNGVATTMKAGELQALHVAMTEVSIHAPTSRVRLDHARPRAVTNTAAAQVSFSVCTVRDTGFIAIRGPLGEYCTDVERLQGTELLVSGDNRQYVVMTVRPTRVGVVRIDGIEVAYARGWRHAWQRGTEATGLEVRIRVRSPS